MRSRFLLPLSLIFAQGASLLIQIFVPRFLGPEEFVRFSLCWTYAQFLVIGLFEWLRNATIRFSAGVDRATSLRRRRVLTRLYAILAFALLALSFLCVILGLWWNWLGAIAASLGYAALRGVFDGAQALARAKFLNRQFIVTWISSSIISVILTLLFAATSGSGLVAFWAMALSFGISVSFQCFRGALKGISASHWDSAQFRFLWTYGSFIALTSLLSSALSPLVRTFATYGTGSLDAAGALLALDLSQKLMASIGLAFNLVFVQYAIRTAEHGTSQEVSQKLKFQTAAAAALIFPAAAGFLAVQDSVSKMMIPDSYLNSYASSIAIATLSACIVSFKSYGIDALFVVSGKSKRAVIGPMTTLLLTCAITLVGAFLVGWSLPLVLIGQFVALSVGALVSMRFARMETGVRWPFNEFMKAAIGSAGIFLLVRGLPGEPGWGHMAMCILTGAAFYVVYAYAVNLCEIRSYFSMLNTYR